MHAGFEVLKSLTSHAEKRPCIMSIHVLLCTEQGVVIKRKEKRLT